MEKFLIIVGGIVVIALLVMFSAFMLGILWGWVIPDVFGGAVKQGILPEYLDFGQALKLSLFLYGVGLTRTSSSKSK